MKKIIIGLIVLLSSFHFAKADMLMGFSDGQGLWNQEGVQIYTCFPDQSCVGKDNVIHQKSDLLGLASINLPVTQPGDTNFPIINPVTNQPLNPIVGGAPQSPITIQADPSFTATSIPATGTQVTLGQWVVTNNTNNSYNLASYISFAFNGNESQNEGFDNIGAFIDGGQTGSWNQNIINSNSAFLSGNFSLGVNSSKTLVIKADPNFSSSTQISSLIPSLQIYQHSGSSLTNAASGTSLSIVH